MCTLIVSDGPAPPRATDAGAAPITVSGRAMEEGVWAPPSTERRPVTTFTPAAGTAACNNRRTENSTEVIHPPGKPGDSRSIVTNPGEFSTFSVYLRHHRTKIRRKETLE